MDIKIKENCPSNLPSVYNHFYFNPSLAFLFPDNFSYLYFLPSQFKLFLCQCDLDVSMFGRHLLYSFVVFNQRMVDRLDYHICLDSPQIAASLCSRVWGNWRLRVL